MKHIGGTRIGPYPDEIKFGPDDKMKNTYKETLQQIHSDLKTKKILFGQDIYALLYGFLNRARLNYTFGDRLEYCFNCLCCRNLSEDKRALDLKRHYLFEKAQRKLHSDLDVVRIIKSLRKIKELTNSFFNQRHRQLMAFSRNNLIETSSSSSDSDDNNYDPVRLMENPNPYARLRVYGRIKKMMREMMNHNLYLHESNLIRSLFKTQLKDFTDN